jgi:hypothetical protein
VRALTLVPEHDDLARLDRGRWHHGICALAWILADDPERASDYPPEVADLLTEIADRVTRVAQIAVQRGAVPADGFKNLRSRQ